MPNFITKIFIVEFFANFKVVELEHEFEPGDLGYWLKSMFSYLVNLESSSAELSET